jgi:hypothetical protein
MEVLLQVVLVPVQVAQVEAELTQVVPVDIIPLVLPELQQPLKQVLQAHFQAVVVVVQLHMEVVQAEMEQQERLLLVIPPLPILMLVLTPVQAHLLCLPV